MSKLLRVYLIIAVVAFSAAFIVQAFLPQVGSATIWGVALGWQREIAFWNIGMLVVIVGILKAKDEVGARVTVTGLVVLGVLLGTNHLFAILSRPSAWGHYLPLLVNYLGVVVGIMALWRERRLDSPKSRETRNRK